jgi:hypothetical protein
MSGSVHGFRPRLVESLVARIACISQIGISLGEFVAVVGRDRAVELLEPIERAAKIAKLVGCKIPISVLLARQSRSCRG